MSDRTDSFPDKPLCAYLLPLRRVRATAAEMKDFGRYFGELSRAGCEVLVIDGSRSHVFEQHNAAWKNVCRHVPVDNSYGYLNGKVNGIHTGVALTEEEFIIVADDDIRYTPDNIRRMVTLLDDSDLVRPQNFFRPLPWWARMEAARMLLNRAVLSSGDYPGTCGFRKSAMERVGHYDGDVLFDNEEMVRHFALNGAPVCNAIDFFILKRPPSFRKWMEQRPRQAYEDFVMRAKTLLFLSLLPLAVVTFAIAGGPAGFVYLLAVVLGSFLLSIRGLRSGAHRCFPVWICGYAPLWVLERSISVYLALYWRITRGGYPFGDNVLSKGTGRAWVAGGRVQLKKSGE